jgi:dUTP pyrophosphatase
VTQVAVKIVRLTSSAKLPEYAHRDDSGLDLFSDVEQEIKPGETGLIGTGIAIELPENIEAQVRPRSGLALKSSVTVLNTPGTVDAGYRGEIRVILINHGKTAFQITKGMKIAQMVVTPVIRVNLEEVQELSKTQRGESGFGSTGS